MVERHTALYDAAGVRALDQLAIESHGVPGYELMCRAGAFCFARLLARWPDCQRAVLVCGTGNNGGDGFVIARLMVEAGLEPRVFIVGDVHNIADDARTALDAMRDAGVEVGHELGEMLRGADVIVDALFGTGLRRALGDEVVHIVAQINAAHQPVLAVDLPSGLSSDTGVAVPVAVRAECTCTFIGLKFGQWTGQGPEFCGDLEFDDLDVPPEIYPKVRPIAELLDNDVLARRLRPRARDAHKGHFGHVLVVGGGHGYAGAVLLAARAAVRAGAGLVTVATRAEHVGLVSACPEAMFVPIESGYELQALAERADVVAVGPGLGQTEWARPVFHAALESGKVVVVDADGLNLMAEGGARVRDLSGLVLTPHPGEAARLIGSSTIAVQRNRLTTAAEISVKFGAICVLKGAGTVVVDNTRRSVVGLGNPGLASGGSGDTLTGITAALLAQAEALSLSQMEAVEVAVCAHAAAADRAALQGERGMLASDVIEHLRPVINPGIDPSARIGR